MKKVLSVIAGILFAGFCVAVLGMMMSMTWGALGKLFPNNFTNRMWGMVLFDIAAMCWALAFAFKSHSVAQYAIAGIGFATGFLGTILMVAAEVILDGQTFVQNSQIGEWVVYGFIAAALIHAALIYAHHGASPTIHQQIEFGIAEGEVTTTAMKQATQYMDVNKVVMAQSMTAKMLENSQRNLGLPIAVDPNIGFVPAEPSSVPYPVQTEPAKKQSWFDRMKGTLKPASMKKNEQVVVDVPKLKEQPMPDKDGNIQVTMPPGIYKSFVKSLGNDTPKAKHYTTDEFCRMAKRTRAEMSAILASYPSQSHAYHYWQARAEWMPDDLTPENFGEIYRDLLPQETAQHLTDPNGPTYHDIGKPKSTEEPPAGDAPFQHDI